MTLRPKRLQNPVLVVFAVIGIVVAAGMTVSTQGRSRPRDVFDGHEAVPGEVLVKFISPARGPRQQLEQQLDADWSEAIGGNAAGRGPVSTQAAAVAK